MKVFIILFSSFCWAGQPVHWSHLLEVAEQHEFYQSNETILKPKDSWQHLFSVIYIDRNINRLKDCVFYKVPGVESGLLKIKTISAIDSCEDQLLNPGHSQVENIKSLQFTLSEKKMNLDFTFNDFRNEKWDAQFQSSFVKPVPKMHLSSAEFKSPKAILLAPQSDVIVAKGSFIKPGSVCHDINEDCESISTYKCDQCAEGWYEIPNGCNVGPKYCGISKCGQKGRPACRRGNKWQRKVEAFDCRMDSSFAYCSKGLSVQCDGTKAYCR